MSEYFLKPISLGANVKAELGLSNYATKADTTVLVNLKSDVDKLDIDRLKYVPSGVNNLKSKADQLDIGKLETRPVDGGKLSNVVRNYVFRKDLYNAKIKNIEDKIPYIANLGTNTTLDAKKNEIKNEIPSITNLATVENKIPDVSNLVEKKLTITQKLVKLKIKLLLVMIMINKLLLKNLISQQQKILLQD